MKQKYLPHFKGIIKDYSARGIPEDKCQDGSNVIFQKGRVKSRWGYQPFGGNLPLNGAITKIQYVEFLKASAGTYLLVFTTRDAYKFNFATGNFDFITQIYAVGHAGVSAGTLSVVDRTVSGAWDNSAWNKVNVYQIKFGSTDPNDGVGTWYNVASVDSPTALTLESPMSGAITAQDYCLRLCFSGDPEDWFNLAIPYDPVISDKIILCTNGVDPLQKWNPTTNAYFQPVVSVLKVLCDTVSGDATVGGSTVSLYAGMAVSGTGIPAGATILSITSDIEFELATDKEATANGTDVVLTFTGDPPNVAKYIGYFGSIGYEHIITGNVQESGTLYKQRIEVSDAGEISWQGINYDIQNTNDEIKGVMPLQARLMVYKENSITEALPNISGGNDDPFQFIQNKIGSVGTPSIRTVVDFGNFHLFFGADNIYVFDGMSVQPVGAEIINNLLKNLNKQYQDSSFGFSLKDEDLYCLFVPYGKDSAEDYYAFPRRGYVYNYKDQSWSIWDFSIELTSFNSFKKEYSPTWASKLTEDYTTGYNGTTTSGSPIITGITSTTLLQAGMQVKGIGIPRKTIAGGSVEIVTVDSPTQVTINVNATLSGMRALRFSDGNSWDEQGLRWRDMIVQADNVSYLLGDSTGNIYEFSPVYTNDAGSNFTASFVTRDYSLVKTQDNPNGDPSYAFKLINMIIGFLPRSTEYIQVRASVDFGANWTSWIDVLMTGTPEDYKESLVNFCERGRMVRFEIRNKNGSFFEIESLNVGYNNAGVIKDF